MRSMEFDWRNANTDTSNVELRVYSSVEVGDQHLTVIEADARTSENGVTIIETPNLESWADEYQVERTSLLAARAAENHPGGARALYVEMPGVNVDFARHPDKLTREQKRDPLRGSLINSAATQLEALERVARFKPGETVQLFGYSLGAHSAKEMAELITYEYADLTISKIDLVETPNLYDRRTLALAYAATRELPYLDRYLVDQNSALGLGDVLPLDRNPSSDIDFNKLRRRQAAARYLPTLALRHGIATELQTLREESEGLGTSRIDEAEIRLWSADGSRLSDDVDHLRASVELDGEFVWCLPTTAEMASDQNVQHHFLLGFGNTALIASQL